MKAVFPFLLGGFLGGFLGAEPPVSRKEAYAVLAPAKRTSSEPSDAAKPTGLDGRVLTGYQGWFRAEGDGSGLGFSHYGKGKRFAPAKDRAWCEKRKIAYLPVLFPGFSWKNMKGPDAEVIPRDGGKFLWRQFQATALAGNRSAYLAMFDELDEGTALFKCTNRPPLGASTFQTYEGLPSDHYLWLSGEGGRLLRGELPRR